jgi:alpha-tubulin suppressor-like RCC1 family protein
MKRWLLVASWMIVQGACDPSEHLCTSFPNLCKPGPSNRDGGASDRASADSNTSGEHPGPLGPCDPGGPGCSDGDPCNGVETCGADGACVGGTPVTCLPVDSCHYAGICDPSTGACSNPAAQAGECSGTTVVGPAGGTVAGPLGLLLEIPEGALSADVSITVSVETEPVRPPGGRTIGPLYRLEPEGLRFDKRIVVSMPRVDHPGLNDIVAFTVPVGGDSFEVLPIIDSDPARLSVETSHFSLVGLTDLGGVTIGDLVGDTRNHYCETDVLDGLSRQLISYLQTLLAPAGVDLVEFTESELVRFGTSQKRGYVLPYLQRQGLEFLGDALIDAATPGEPLRLSSVLRTVAQEYLLVFAAVHPECGVRLPVGCAGNPLGCPTMSTSPHYDGHAFDVVSEQHAALWQSTLSKYGWLWQVASPPLFNDPIHFNFDREQIVDARSFAIVAFQVLWNVHNPCDQIAVDGRWGAETEARLRKTPITGFRDTPANGCCAFSPLPNHALALGEQCCLPPAVSCAGRCQTPSCPPGQTFDTTTCTCSSACGSGLQITGPLEVSQQTQTQFTATALFADGSRRPVAAAWSLFPQPSWITLTNTGLLKVGESLDSRTVEVRASYTCGGVLGASLPVLVRSSEVLPKLCVTPLRWEAKPAGDDLIVTVTNCGGGGPFEVKLTTSPDATGWVVPDAGGFTPKQFHVRATPNTTGNGRQGLVGVIPQRVYDSRGALIDAAYIEVRQHTRTSAILTVSRQGQGRVTSVPAGLDCGPVCEFEFSQGSGVRLTATASPGWGFDGWSGACAGADRCQPTLALQDLTVKATFTADQPVQGLLASNTGPVKAGLPVAFQAKIVQGTHLTYSWDFGDGTTGNGVSATHTYAAPGLYEATVTASNSRGSLLARTAVTVLPPEPVTGLEAASDAPKAPGQPIAFQATVTTGTAVSFHWNFGDGQSAIGAAVSHAYTAEGSYDVTLIASNATSSAIVHLAIAVAVVEIESLSVSPPTMPLRAGRPAEFVASIKQGTTVTYSWDFGDGGGAVGARVSHTFAEARSYIVTVRAQNAHGATEASTAVTVLPPLKPQLLNAAGYSMVLMPNGKPWVWGENYFGRLALQSYNFGGLVFAPFEHQGLTDYKALAGGESFVLGIREDGTVWAWGRNSQGQLGSEPVSSQCSGCTATGCSVCGNSTARRVAGIDEVVAVAAGAGHSLALRKDGIVWAWGSNAAGMLGDGTTVSRHTPAPVVGLTDVVAVAADGSDSHSLALKRDGTVWGWGYNFNGQVGDGTTVNRSAPIRVVGLSDVTAIATGSQRSFAVTSAGSVYAWGWEAVGGSSRQPETRATPTKVEGISDAFQVSAADRAHGHVLVLTKTGNLWAWGNAGGGVLGYISATGNNEYRWPPFQFPNMCGVYAAKASAGRNLIMKDDGTTWAWGGNEGPSTRTPTTPLGSMLGIGTPYPATQPTPTRTVVAKPATPPGCGDGRCSCVESCESCPQDCGTCCVAGTGPSCSCKPGYAPAPGGTGCLDVDECKTNNGGCDPLRPCINAGGARSCGSCPAGYTDDGTTACRDVNECLVGNGGCDSLVSCTNISGGRVCGPCPAGYGGSGETGCVDVDECKTNNGGCDPLTACSNRVGGRDCGPCPAGYTGDGATGCVDIDECKTNNGGCDALTVCKNKPGTRACGPCPISYGGTGSTGCVQVDPGSIIEIRAGQGHSCALLAGGKMYCWGNGWFGQLGNGAWGGTSATPVQVVNVGPIRGAFLVGNRHTCAFTADGTTFCWGADNYGQLGDPRNYPKSGSDLPLQVMGLPAVTAGAAGFDHSCAVAEQGTVHCWGRGDDGQLGNGLADSPVPVRVAGINNAVAVAAGYSNSCALTALRSVFCWGDRDPVPKLVDDQGDVVAISLGGVGGDRCLLSANGALSCGRWSSPPAVTDVSAGFQHTCAVTSEGRVFCWGRGIEGQLGNGLSGPTSYSATPVEVIGLSKAVRVAAGVYHTCALLADGAIKCWGRGDSGELGDGMSKNSLVPVTVLWNP